MSTRRVIDGEVYDARLEAQQIREDARRAGHEEGRAQAQVELAATLTVAAERDRRRIAAAEKDLVTLAVRIAEKIVRRQLTLTPDVVTDCARAALAHARARRHVTLRVHPDDVPLVAALAVDVVADASIERGGCVVDTELGRIDARLDAQLRALERALVEDT